MRPCLLGIPLVMIAATVSAQQTAGLPDLQAPHQIVVEGNTLYVFDEADYSLHLYTVSPLAPTLTFGRKGDGPHDFKHLPFVFVQPDSLACTDFTKIIWFSRKGDVLRAMPFSGLKDFDINSERLLVPAGDRFLRITADHEHLTRRVSLVDSRFAAIKTLYEGPFVWMQGSRTDYRTDTVVAGGLVFVADTFKGLYISVFDLEGTLLRTIDRTADVEEVPDRARLHQFCVSEGRIYATTYKKVDGKTEMIVLDLEGRLLRRLYLPLPDLNKHHDAGWRTLYTEGPYSSGARGGPHEHLVQQIESGVGRSADGLPDGTGLRAGPRGWVRVRVLSEVPQGVR